MEEINTNNIYDGISDESQQFIKIISNIYPNGPKNTKYIVDYFYTPEGIDTIQKLINPTKFRSIHINSKLSHILFNFNIFGNYDYWEKINLANEIPILKNILNNKVGEISLGSIVKNAVFTLDSTLDKEVKIQQIALESCIKNPKKYSNCFRLYKHKFIINKDKGKQLLKATNEYIKNMYFTKHIEAIIIPNKVESIENIEESFTLGHDLDLLWADLKLIEFIKNKGHLEFMIELMASLNDHKIKLNKLLTKKGLYIKNLALLESVMNNPENTEIPLGIQEFLVKIYLCSKENSLISSQPNIQNKVYSEGEPFYMF